MKFKGTAVNNEGLTFGFVFDTPGWGEKYAELDAKNALVKIVKGNPLHEKYGPWVVRHIDVAAG